MSYEAKALVIIGWAVLMTAAGICVLAWFHRWWRRG